jgi:hypothetical protein
VTILEKFLGIQKKEVPDTKSSRGRSSAEMLNQVSSSTGPSVNDFLKWSNVKKATQNATNDANITNFNINANNGFMNNSKSNASASTTTTINSRNSNESRSSYEDASQSSIQQQQQKGPNPQLRSLANHDPFLKSHWPPWLHERLVMMDSNNSNNNSNPVSSSSSSSSSSSFNTNAASMNRPKGRIIWWVHGCRRVNDNCVLTFGRWLAYRLHLPLVAVALIHPHTYLEALRTHKASFPSSSSSSAYDAARDISRVKPSVYNGAGASMFCSALLELKSKLDKLSIPLEAIVAHPKKVFIFIHVCILVLLFGTIWHI